MILISPRPASGRRVGGEGHKHHALAQLTPPAKICRPPGLIDQCRRPFPSPKEHVGDTRWASKQQALRQQTKFEDPLPVELQVGKQCAKRLSNTPITEAIQASKYRGTKIQIACLRSFSSFPMKGSKSDGNSDHETHDRATRASPWNPPPRQSLSSLL